MAVSALTLNQNQTVRDIVVENPQATLVFDKYGIDYCCGGGKSLAEACQKAGIAFETLQAALDGTIQDASAREQITDWSQVNPGDLIHHIIETHHAFVRFEIARLGKLLDKVVAVHGENHPELRQVQNVFYALSQDLMPHLMKEEQVLFPFIDRLEKAVASQMPVPMSCFGTVANPIRMMEFEHDQAGDLLKEMRRVTSDFTVPEDGCFSYQALYNGLKGFEADLHQHIHLENNILFPKAKQLEDQVFGR